MTSTITSTTTTTTSLSTSSTTTTDVDERNLAAQALAAAEDSLQSLCATHAGTFVRVERRGRAWQQHLRQLLEHLEQLTVQTAETQRRLAQDEEENDDDHDDDDTVERHPTLAALAEQHRVRRRTLLQHSVGTIPVYQRGMVIALENAGG